MDHGQRRYALALAAALLALTAIGHARAQCRPLGQFATCLDADPVWPSASPAPLVMVNPASVLPARQLVIGVATSHATRLVTIEVPAPDPAGRELPIVRQVTTFTLLTTLGIGSRSEATLSIPWTVAQQGLGLDGITSQSGDSLAQHPFRDPRMGFASVVWRHRGRTDATLGTRYTIVLPLGNAGALAGDRGVVGVPAFAMDLHRGRFFAGAETSARLRRPTRLANVRLGTQFVVASGIGVEVVEDGALTLSAEAFLAPTLVEQPERTSAFAPAEWLLSASTTPLGTRGPSISLGGGGGLPLSTSAGASVVGMTSPALRLVAIVRQPLSRPRSPDHE